MLRRKDRKGIQEWGTKKKGTGKRRKKERKEEKIEKGEERHMREPGRGRRTQTQTQTNDRSQLSLLVVGKGEERRVE